MITLQEIHMEQFWDVIDLSVRPEQAEFCTSNAVSIAQSKVQSECIPLAIYDGETPVGFLMYCVDRDDGEWWIYRLMVDARFQGGGCGTAALALVLERMRADATRSRVFLGVHRQAAAAVALYERAGFRFTGQVFGAEHIMRLDW